MQCENRNEDVIIELAEADVVTISAAYNLLFVYSLGTGSRQPVRFDAGKHRWIKERNVELPSPSGLAQTLRGNGRTNRWVQGLVKPARDHSGYATGVLREARADLTQRGVTGGKDFSSHSHF